jgi:polar amino acid transport system substrate-binding protein
VKPFVPFIMLLVACSRAEADEVTMAFGDSLPPYILAESNSGIEIDVVSAALAYRKHVLVPRYLPMARITAAFRDRQVDAVMMDVGEDLSKYGHYAEPPVLYDNVFITLKQRGIRIRKPSDLDKLTVMSFVGAAARYPEWLGRGTKGGLHKERNNQAVQPVLLNLGRYDVVLSDRNIYKYYELMERRRNAAFHAQPVEEHAFTVENPRHYRPVFRDPAIQRDFDEGLKYLKKSGRYQAIFDRYLKG